MGLGDAQNLACLFARQSFNITQRNHLPLKVWKPFDGLQHDGGDGCGEQTVVDVAPWIKRRSPRAPIIKAVGVDARIRGSRGDGAVVGDPAGPTSVGADPVQPRLQRRTTLEALHSTDHRKPRVLCHVLGALRVSDKTTGEPNQAGVVPADQLTEGSFVPGLETLEQLPVFGHEAAAYRPDRNL